VPAPPRAGGPPVVGAGDEPVRVGGLALALGVVGRGAVAAEHEVALALLDVALLGRGATVCRQRVLVLRGRGVEALVLEGLVAGGAVVDVPAGAARAVLLALGAAPNLLALVHQPRPRGQLAVVLRGREALPVSDRSEGGVLIPVVLLGLGEVRVAHPTRTGWTAILRVE